MPKLPKSWQGNQWLLGVIKNDTRLALYGFMPRKQSPMVLDRVKSFRNRLVASWRFHSDGEREF